jgi:pyruvate/2-oxoglutarate dehydrogenase complex dihydrolipoamide acyltransferase (E2) component
MKIRLALALAAASLLSACTDADWSRNMSFIGLTDTADNSVQPVAEATQPAAASAPRPMAQTATAQAAPAQTAQAGVNPFCAAVARQDADGHGFDAATQQGIFVRSYQQCVTVFGNVSDQ